MAGSRLRGNGMRLAWAAIGVVLAATVAATAVAGVRLHDAVLLERQTLRTEQLTQAALALHLSTGSAAARSAAQAAFDSVAGHDRAEGSRLAPAFRSFLDAPNAAPRLARLERAIASETARQTRETRVQNPRTRAALIAGAVGAALLVCLLVRLFELERRAGRIDRENASRAEELIRLRDEFVAVVSHELRSPLTSITGYLELLADEGTDNLTAEQAAHLAVVARSAERLTELVADLLLVAESDRRPLDLEPVEVDLAVLADHAVRAARPPAEARGIALGVDHGEPAIVHGDANRLAQVLDNLVSNAIKFTPPGGSVTVRTGFSGDTALLEVRDTGAGISSSDRHRLFEPFYRASEATRQAVPGTGLGLTITKAIVDAHRGAIEIDSKPGRGTTVRVRLPVHAPAASALA